MPPLVIEDESDMLLASPAAGRMLMFPVSDLPQLFERQGQQIISIPAAEAAAGQDGLAHLFCSAAAEYADHSRRQNGRSNCVRRAAKKSPASGRRGSLMRGLQKIDRVEIDSPRRAAAGDSEE
ncbi:Topoisomerase IV subunit A [Klebsiella pneumoniae]|uniref:Topoisomerase IV subunit A n=1 Tax=Klebsiella pneumoniae TaxID=573 RepID=A0A378FVV4_KLEPN|nr:Topoisomerase IV subunit A [Klebsiella pneumoniae]